MSHDPSLLSPLGKATEYRADYAPELLFPIPRQIKRDESGSLAMPCPLSVIWIRNCKL